MYVLMVSTQVEYEQNVTKPVCMADDWQVLLDKAIFDANGKGLIDEAGYWGGGYGESEEGIPALFVDERDEHSQRVDTVYYIVFIPRV